MKEFLINRFSEPSTWRALIWVATSFGLALNPDQASAIVALGAALAGGIGIVTPDRLFTKNDRNK